MPLLLTLLLDLFFFAGVSEDDNASVVLLLNGAKNKAPADFWNCYRYGKLLCLYGMTRQTTRHYNRFLCLYGKTILTTRPWCLYSTTKQTTYHYQHHYYNAIVIVIVDRGTTAVNTTTTTPSLVHKEYSTAICVHSLYCITWMVATRNQRYGGIKDRNGMASYDDQRKRNRLSVLSMPPFFVDMGGVHINWRRRRRRSHTIAIGVRNN